MRSSWFGSRSEDNDDTLATAPSKLGDAASMGSNEVNAGRNGPEEETMSMPTNHLPESPVAGVSGLEMDPSDNLYNHGNPTNSYPSEQYGMSHDKYLFGVRSDSTDASSRAMWRSYSDDDETREGSEEQLGSKSNITTVSQEQRGPYSPALARSRSPMPPGILKTPSRGSMSAGGNSSDREPPESNAARQVRTPSPRNKTRWSPSFDSKSSEQAQSAHEYAAANPPAAAVPDKENPPDVTGSDSLSSNSIVTPPENPAATNIPGLAPSPSSVSRSFSLRKEHFPQPDQDGLENEGIEVVDGRLSRMSYLQLRKKLPGSKSPRSDESSKDVQAQKTDTPKETTPKEAPKPAPASPTESDRYLPPAKAGSENSQAANVGAASSSQASSSPVKGGDQQAKPASVKQDKKKGGSKARGRKDKRSSSRGRRRSKSAKRATDVETIPKEIVFDADNQEIPMPQTKGGETKSRLVITQEIENKNSGQADMDIIDLVPAAVKVEPSELEMTKRYSEATATFQQNGNRIERISSAKSASNFANFSDFITTASSCGTDLGLYDKVPQITEMTRRTSSNLSKDLEKHMPNVSCSGFGDENVLCEDCEKRGVSKRGKDGNTCHKCLMLRVRSTVKSAAESRRAAYNNTTSSLLSAYRKEVAQQEKATKQASPEKQEPQDLGTVKRQNHKTSPTPKSSVTKNSIITDEPTADVLAQAEENGDFCFQDPQDNVARLCALFPKQLMSYNSMNDTRRSNSKPPKSKRSKSRTRRPRKAELRGPVPIMEIEYPTTIETDAEMDILETVSSLTFQKRKKKHLDAKKGDKHAKTKYAASWSARLRQLDIESKQQQDQGKLHARKRRVMKFFAGPKRSGKSNTKTTEHRREC